MWSESKQNKKMLREMSNLFSLHWTEKWASRLFASCFSFWWGLRSSKYTQHTHKRKWQLGLFSAHNNENHFSYKCWFPFPKLVNSLFFQLLPSFFFLFLLDVERNEMMLLLTHHHLHFQDDHHQTFFTLLPPSSFLLTRNHKTRWRRSSYSIFFFLQM